MKLVRLVLETQDSGLTSFSYNLHIYLTLPKRSMKIYITGISWE